MVKVGVDLPSEIEGDNVGIAAMIDESSLVAIKHAIEAQWEKLVKVDLLNDLLPFISLRRVVKIEEIGKATCIIVCASHITLLFGHNLTQILHQEGASRYLLQRNETPHRDILSITFLFLFLWHFRDLIIKLALCNVCQLLNTLVNRRQSLLNPPNQKLELLLVLMSHQIVLAQVFIASASGMALIETEDFVQASLRPMLEGDHLA